MVQAADVARVIAAVVVGDPVPDGVSVTGPAALTMTEAATLLSEFTGRHIRYVDGEPEEYFSRLVAEGSGERYARDLTTLCDQIIRAGYAGSVSNSVEPILQRKPLTFAQFAADHIETFRSTGKI